MRILLSRAAFVGTLAVAALSLAFPAQAQLIDEDFVTGASLLPAGDDVTVNVALTTPFTFFGTVYNSVFVSTNGILAFTDNPDFFSDLFPNATSGPVIAPLWADWFTDVDPTYAAVYYRQEADRLLVTWDVRHVEDETIVATFQAALGADDGITFGYGLIDPRYADYGADVNPLEGDAALTGLNAGDGVNAVGGTERSTAVSYGQIAFTPSGNTYSAIITNVSPEPGTLALLGCGLLSLGRVVRRRK